MKLILLLFLLLMIPACENGVRISYNPESLDKIYFIKSEKLDGNELNCDYGEDSHKHSSRSNYYIYFTMNGDNFSPVLEKEGTFETAFKDLKVQFIKDGIVDKNVKNQSDLEFISLRDDDKKNLNLALLLDITKYNVCNGSNDEECSFSGSGYTGSKDIQDFLGRVKSFLNNGYGHFKTDGAVYPMKSFFGTIYMAFSMNKPWSGGEGNTGYYQFNSNYKSLYGKTANKQYTELTKASGESYKGVEALKHRKLFDNYLTATGVLKKKSNKIKNQSLVMFLKGYEEGVFDLDGKLTPGNLRGNKSESTEEDFINALDDATKSIPVFIGACRDQDKCSKTGESLTKENDNSLYKIACKTGGAYFPEFYDKNSNSWKEASSNSADYTSFFDKVEYSVYGMWRIKVQMDDTEDGDYTGTVKFTVGDDKSIEVGYKIVR